jgi:hypothetical protein
MHCREAAVMYAAAAAATSRRSDSVLPLDHLRDARPLATSISELYAVQKVCAVTRTAVKDKAARERGCCLLSLHVLFC